MSELKNLFDHIGFSLILIIFASLIVSQLQVDATKSKKDVSRKSIVFDIKTPKVFYCPQEKQSDFSKMIVKARPLEKLCEFAGEGKPKNSASDCYNDLDETEFACEEKKRFLLRLDLSNDFDPVNAPQENLDDTLTKDFDRKEIISGKKF